MVPVFYLPRCKNPNPVMLPQPIKLGLISETFYILEYLLKQLQTMFKQKNVTLKSKSVIIYLHPPNNCNLFT